MRRFKSYGTGAAAIAVSFNPKYKFLLHQIRIHFNAAEGNAEALTIDLDSGESAVYDVNIDTVSDMTLVTDYIWNPENGVPMSFEATDKILIACANTSTKTYGVEIIYSLGD